MPVFDFGAAMPNLRWKYIGNFRQVRKVSKQAMPAGWREIWLTAAAGHRRLSRLRAGRRREKPAHGLTLGCRPRGLWLPGSDLSAEPADVGSGQNAPPTPQIMPLRVITAIMPRLSGERGVPSLSSVGR